MLISVTGILIDHQVKTDYCGSTGFSLLELLIVLMIIGILIGGLTFSINPGNKDVETEARRFGALVEMASDQAILRSEEYAVRLTPGKYLFFKRSNNKWQSLDSADVFRNRSIPGLIDVELFLDGERVDLKEDSTSLSDEEKLPQIYLYSSGEATRFTVIFFDKTLGFKFKVENDKDIRVQVTQFHEEN